MKYRALIFDFDYTLGDTTASIVASINYALSRLGYAPHPVAEIKKTIGYTLAEAFRMLTGEADGEKEKLFFDYFQIKADEVMTSDARLFPHAEQLLVAWSSRFRLAIVSTKHRFRIEDILKKFSLQDVVGCVIGNEDVKNEKPHPEGVLLAASKLGVPLEEILYIGDSLVDAEAAARAGVDFAAVTTGTTAREAFCAFPHVTVQGDLDGLDAFLSAR